MANIALEADFTFKASVADKLKTDGLMNPYLSPLNEKIFIKEAYDQSAIWVDTAAVKLGKDGGGAIALQWSQLFDVNHVVGVSDTPSYYGWTWRTDLTDWISPEYHKDYEILVYHAPAGTAYDSALSLVDNTATPYVIDYITGALSFIASVPSYLGSHVLYFRGYTYTGRKGLSAVATTGSYNDLEDKPNIVIDFNNLLNKPSLCNVALSGLATDLSYPDETHAPFILHKNINWLLPSIDAVQANWNTTDVGNKPPIQYANGTTLITGNMECTSNIVCANNVYALQFNGSGNALTDLPAIWKINGTHRYTNFNVGVGTTSPSVALDVSGSVKVSGGLVSPTVNTGNVDTKTFVVTGTTSSVKNGTVSVVLPTGCIESNIISIKGVIYYLDTTYASALRGMINVSLKWDAWVAGGSLYVWIGSSATLLRNGTFKVVITTT